MAKLREVVHSCSNPRVAAAALASLGGAVAEAVCAQAARDGVTPGEFVAQLVGEFRDDACSSLWTSAERAMRRSELPVLTGLHLILAHTLIRKALFDQDETGGEPTPIAVSKTRSRKIA